MSTTQTRRRAPTPALGDGVARPTTVTKPPRPIKYRESDGKPLAETGLHVDEIFRLLGTLMARYRHDPLILVGSNQFLYYEEGNPRRAIAPDLYLTKGIPKQPPRNTYLLWVERRPPNFVVEVTSPKTRREDQGKKRAIYAQIGVAEYVLYDPLGEYLRPALQAFRLGASGYEPMALDVGGAFLSDELGLRLVLESGRLQFYDRQDGRRLLSFSEQAELEREQARVAAHRANAEAERANVEAHRANVEAEARRTAEARVEELEALLRQFRPPTP